MLSHNTFWCVAHMLKASTPIQACLSFLSHSFELVSTSLIENECFVFFYILCGRFQCCNKRTLLLTIEPVPICPQNTDNTNDSHLSTDKCGVVSVKYRHTSLAQQLINWASYDVIVAHYFDIISWLSNKYPTARVLK